MQLISSEKPARHASLLSAAVVVAALGYFVDIYDLVLFSIVRVPSLKALGIADAAILDQGVLLLNMQMAGMLVGGILWGVLGDKRGRLTVLFGSILLYSLANIANGFVQELRQYAALRLIAGIGLAGELGAGITLVSEVLPKEKRGYGTMIVATVGVSGAMLAYWVGEQFGWRTAYFIGGGLGLALLILRVSVFESGMFEKAAAAAHIRRGDFLSLFSNPERLQKYLKCILMGIPLWFVVGILITFAPEFGRELGISGEVSAGKGVFWCYFGLVFGDFLTGWLSQRWRSRNRVMLVFLGLSAVLIAVYLFALRGSTLSTVYAVCFALGLGSGYWAVFVTIAAEQFGTNVRATVATTVPNFVRGSVVPMTLAFQALKGPLTLVGAAAILGAIVLLVAVWAVATLPESYGKELDYYE
ncbi:MFS transporter [Hymenobacter sp. DG25B]|uniref:MFS transporter n=1 Tax=Hymenobacter sp. DG25B TaxID=1385664 RepID=UPI0009E2B0A9|nr:MFS transporter [Hymenobacter sp. DG25B]